MVVGEENGKPHVAVRRHAGGGGGRDGRDGSWCVDTEAHPLLPQVLCCGVYS